MRNQNLFNALQDVCNFTALQSDLDQIIRAVKKDEELDTEHCNCGQNALKYTTHIEIPTCGRCGNKITNPNQELKLEGL
jgi:hypothetical protein